MREKIIVVKSCRDCPYLYLSEGYLSVYRCRKLNERILKSGKYPEKEILKTFPRRCPL